MAGTDPTSHAFGRLSFMVEVFQNANTCPILDARLGRVSCLFFQKECYPFQLNAA